MKYALTALAVAVLGVGVWIVFFVAPSTPDIAYRVVSVQLGDPEQVVVTFEVVKDPATEAECQVTATGKKRDIVNRLTGIRIPKAAQRRTVHKVTVPTDQLATDASVAYCTITGT